MITIKHVIIAWVAGLSALPAAAEDTANNGSERRLGAVEARDTRQDTRISNGLASGQINTNEAARLDAGQARVDNTTARLAADGNFSRRDYARVDHRQNHASRGIARARNNKR